MKKMFSVILGATLCLFAFNFASADGLTPTISAGTSMSSTKTFMGAVGVHGENLGASLNYSNIYDSGDRGHLVDVRATFATPIAGNLSATGEIGAGRFANMKHSPTVYPVAVGMKYSFSKHIGVFAKYERDMNEPPGAPKQHGYAGLTASF